MISKRTEYEVQEQQSSGSNYWFRHHGYIGTNKREAWNSYKHMHATYSKYGRNFRLIRRKITTETWVIG